MRSAVPGQPVVAIVAVAFALALAVTSAGLTPAVVAAEHAQLRRGSVRALAAGKLLVAARNLPDPNFAASVIVLVDFSRQGAMGLIVNRRTTVALSRLMPDLEHGAGGEALAFFGGPVSPTGVLGLLRSTSPRVEGRQVTDGVVLVSTRDALDQLLASGIGADRFRVYLGYAGWGAGQLERETSEGAWHVLDGDAAIVFDPEPDATWRTQIKRTEVLSAGRASAAPGGEVSGF